MDDAAARAIVAKYGEMRSELASASGRLADLAGEEAEHGLVAKALTPMEAGRRCWRLVGDVLVERTVGEVLPAVQSNQAQLGELLKKLRADVAAKEQALADYEKQHGIRVRDGPGPPQAASASAAARAGAPASAPPPAKAGKGEGVLV